MASYSGVSERRRHTQKLTSKTSHGVGQMAWHCQTHLIWIIVIYAYQYVSRCALIHCHRPDLIKYSELDKSDRHGNTRLAFQVAAEHLQIPQLLEVEDLCDKGQPDERSVMTYIASFFHAFSSMGKYINFLGDLPLKFLRPSWNRCSSRGEIRWSHVHSLAE